MFKVFESLKSIIKPSETIIDNKVFTFHYKATGVILLVFTAIVTASQFIGDPIKCVSNKVGDDKVSKLFDSYCWIHSTYTLPSAYNKIVGQDIIYPGIDKTTPDEDKKYHRYYQWVCFMLFLQAAMFYAPHYIWVAFERNRIRNMIFGLSSPIVKEEKGKPTKVEAVQLLAIYFVDSMGNHRAYAITFFICEALNLVNVIFQIFFVNIFLGGEFSKYGAEVVQFMGMDQENRTDPMSRVFPKMTKCSLNTYGPSGDVQHYDALCILPINIVNEKIYVFLWFWFVVLSIVSGLMMIWRIVTLVFARVRTFALRIHNRYANVSLLELFVRKGDFGDWLVLHLLEKNMDMLNFRDLVEEIGVKLKSSKQRNGEGEALMTKAQTTPM